AQQKFAIARARSPGCRGDRPQRQSVCRTSRKKIRLTMRERSKCDVFPCWGIIFALIFLSTANALAERSTKTSATKTPRSNQAKQAGRQDDSLNPKPAPDLALRTGGAHKADALAHFVEGMAFEENGE